MTPIIASRATIRSIHEHHRTIFGRRDPLTGGSTTESINLGWFVHLDFGPESGPISFCVGPEMPKGISVGDEVFFALFKPTPKGESKLTAV